MHVVLYDCLVLSLYRYYPNITIIVYKYYVLFAFKNLICTRHNILISIFIFISVNCLDSSHWASNSEPLGHRESNTIVLDSDSSMVVLESLK